MMNAEIFQMMERFDRQMYVEGLKAAIKGWEVYANEGWHDVEIVPDLAKPGRVWGDRTMTVQQWPASQPGEIIQDGEDWYRVEMNIVTAGSQSQYRERWAIFARSKISPPVVEAELPRYT